MSKHAIELGLNAAETGLKIAVEQARPSAWMQLLIDFGLQTEPFVGQIAPVLLPALAIARLGATAYKAFAQERAVSPNPRR